MLGDLPVLRLAAQTGDGRMMVIYRMAMAMEGRKIFRLLILRRELLAMFPVFSVLG